MSEKRLTRHVGVFDSQAEFWPFVKSGEILPAMGSRIFSLADPQQTEAVVRIVEADDGAKTVLDAGALTLSDLPLNTVYGPRIEVTLIFDHEGNMTIVAKDLFSGKEAKEKASVTCLS